MLPALEAQPNGAELTPLRRLIYLRQLLCLISDE